MQLYRTESYSGLNERDAISVMTFETEELNNTDILDTVLARGYLKNNEELAENVRRASESLSACGEDPDDEAPIDIENLMRQILDEIRDTMGIDVKYVLWLAPLETVAGFYGKDMADPYDYDVYETGPVILSDLGDDGLLFGYETMPQPLENIEKKPALKSTESE